MRIVCYEGKPSVLLAMMSAYELDLVLSDSPMGPEVKLKAFNHLLGECGVSVLAPRGRAKRYGRDFPHSLDGAPFLLPTENTSLRGLLDQWFLRSAIRPKVVGEFEDSALLKVFAGAGRGLFSRRRPPSSAKRNGSTACGQWGASRRCGSVTMQSRSSGN